MYTFLKRIVLFCLALSALKPHQSSQKSVIPIRHQRNSFTLSFYIGLQKKRVYLPINTDLPFSWTCQGDYNYTESKTGVYIKNETVEIRNKKYNSMKFSDTLSNKARTLRLNNFKFYRVEIYSYYFENSGVGFGLNFLHQEDSLIHQMYSNGLIPRRAFSFASLDSGLYTFLGGLPKGHNLRQNAGKCRVEKDQKSWNCYMNSITINKEVFPINNFVVVHSAKEYINVSPMLYHYINETLLDNFYKSKDCRYKVGMFKGIILCKEGILKSLPSITFDFDNFYFNIPMKAIFLCGFDHTEYCEGEIEIKEKEFVLGYHFLKFFNYSLFDYETKTVEFYSENISIVNKKSKIGKMVFQIITSLIALLGLWACFLYFSNLFGNKVSHFMKKCLR